MPEDISLLWRGKSISVPIDVVSKVYITIAQQIQVLQFYDYKQ